MNIFFHNRVQNTLVGYCYQALADILYGYHNMICLRKSFEAIAVQWAEHAIARRNATAQPLLPLVGGLMAMAVRYLLTRPPLLHATICACGHIISLFLACLYEGHKCVCSRYKTPDKLHVKLQKYNFLARNSNIWHKFDDFGWDYITV